MTDSSIALRMIAPETDAQKWWLLIHETETVRAWWHLGLANVWQKIHQGDYERARENLDVVLTDVAQGKWGPPRDEPRLDGIWTLPQNWQDALWHRMEFRSLALGSRNE